jgi:hypothetical protein
MPVHLTLSIWGGEITTGRASRGVANAEGHTDSGILPPVTGEKKSRGGVWRIPTSSQADNKCHSREGGNPGRLYG